MRLSDARCIAKYQSLLDVAVILVWHIAQAVRLWPAAVLHLLVLHSHCKVYVVAAVQFIQYSMLSVSPRSCEDQVRWHTLARADALSDGVFPRTPANPLTARRMAAVLDSATRG